MRKLPKFLDETDVVKLWEAMESPTDRLMAKVGYYLGLRVSELVGICWEDINLKNSTAKITWQNAKGSKERIVPIPLPLEKELKHWSAIMSPSGRLFKMSSTTAWRRIKRAGKVAGLASWVTCHTLRHSYATTLLKGCKRLEIVQDNLGHASIVTTRIYAQCCTEDRQAEVDKTWK